VAQQLSPRPPHRAHIPSPAVLVHCVPALHRSAGAPAGQHDSFKFPHDVQMPLLQVSPS
jgi:hypothetical protein